MVVVLEVYGAREDPQPGISGSLIATGSPTGTAAAPERCCSNRRWPARRRPLAALLRPGDLVVTMGAGDVTMLGPEMLAALEER